MLGTASILVQPQANPQVRYNTINVSGLFKVGLKYKSVHSVMSLL
jgi:hypothetical protein